MLEHAGRKDICRLQHMVALSLCPACSSGKIYEYRDGRWTEWICWRCGHYESDTPAFKAYPHLFHDIVRKNGNYFLVKYAYYGKGIVRNPEPSGS